MNMRGVTKRIVYVDKKKNLAQFRILEIEVNFQDKTKVNCNCETSL